jgi:hypothetical protein
MSHRDYQRGASSSIAILIVLFVVLGAMLWGLWPRGKSFEEVVGFPLPWEQRTTPATVTDEGFVSIPERLQIEEWITRNRLNQYGDPADTLYAGGSPLMDETTGKLMTRYEYLLKMHPDRPWRK